MTVANGTPETIAEASDRRRESVVLYLVCIGAAVLLSMLTIELSGASWRTVVEALLDGAVRDPGRWGVTLQRAAPLLIVAVGSVVATRAGIINIGQEGQVLVGAAAAAFVLTKVAPGNPMMLVLGLALGTLVGATWAGIAGALQQWRGIPVVLSTLLLGYLASQLVAYTLTRSHLLLDVVPGEPNRILASRPVAPDSRLGIIEVFGNSFSLAVPVAVLTAVAASWVLARTVHGFRLKMLGLDPRTAHRAGVSHVKYGMTAILVSGAAAGLAGSMMLAGGEGQYKLSSGFAANAGWDGLLVALVARNSPLAAVPVAIVFAGLRSGSTYLSVAGVEAVLVDVVRALLVLALFVPPAITDLRRRRRVASTAERI